MTSAQTYPVGHAQWAANRNMNSNVYDYKCKECTAEFNVESLLNAHIDRAHNIKYIYNCTQCSNVFCNKNDVEKHIFDGFHCIME